MIIVLILTIDRFYDILYLIKLNKGGFRVKGIKKTQFWIRKNSVEINRVAQAYLEKKSLSTAYKVLATSCHCSCQSE